MGSEDAKRGRKRAVADHETAKPPAKRPAIAGDSSAPVQQERVRSDVRALFESYNALINRSRGAVDSGAFQALLKAAQGEVASQRLAARLVPRFIGLFPDQVEVAASVLIKLSERYQEQGDPDQPLEEHTRRDALHGLQAVLLAAASGTPHGSQAVKLILTVLFRLLSQSEAEAPSTEELEEEEGEVASAEGQAAAAAAGPWVRKVLRQSLQHHPVATLTFCFGCLGPSGRNSSSSSSSSASLAVVQGVRLWLREHILREATPSREGTPMDCDVGTPRAAGAAALAARGCNSLAAAAAAGAAGIVNGGQAHKAAAAAGCAGTRGCVLQSVLSSSADLRAWVRREAKGLSRAPEEMKAVLQAAVQLLPPERQPSKRPSPTGSPQQQQQRPAPFGNQAAGASRPQQPPQFQQPSPQQQQQPAQHKAPNGVAQRQVNGMEPLGRAWSIPSPSGRGPRGRTALGRPPDPAAAAAAAAAAEGAGWGQFPRPAGPICRLEPCVLLTNVPWHIKQQDLQQQLQAAEAWILDAQPPAGPGSSSGGGGARACCVYKTPLDAARTYMRHHKNNKLSLQSPLVQVLFASGLPACSRGAAAAASAPSVYIWALRAVAGDAEKVTEDLRVAGLVPKNVSRVNHGDDPGTVLEAHTAKEASDILAFLLKTHSAAVAAAQPPPQQQQQQQEELPPLPPEPPPGDWTPAGNRAGKPPSTPASAAAGGGGGGGGPPRQQQHQSGPLPLDGPSPLQQQQGYGPPNVRRTSSLPVGGGTPAGPNSKLDGGWRPGGPGHGSSNQGGWGTPQQQQWGHPGSQWGQQGASPGQGPPGNEAGGRPGWQHGTPPPHHMQQQQGRRPPGGGQPGGSAGGAQDMPPFPGPPAAPQQQQQGLQRQHGYAGASPISNTPSHAGSPAGSGQVPPLPPGQVPPGPPGHMQQQYAGAQVLWRGALLKSDVPVGTVCCMEAAPGGHRQSASAPEPRNWPDALHVNQRTKVTEVLDQYVAAAPHLRAVRVMIPQDSPPGNAQAIQHFVQYLTTKNRAGLVKLPGGHGAGPRALYLVVPQADVCQALQVPWDGRCVMLIVVVVPQPLLAGGGPSVGGAAGPRGGTPGGYPSGYPPGHHPGHRPMR